MDCSSTTDCFDFFCELQHDATRKEPCSRELSGEGCDLGECGRLHVSQMVGTNSYRIFPGAHTGAEISELVSKFPRADQLVGSDPTVRNNETVTLVTTTCNSSLATELFDYLADAMKTSHVEAKRSASSPGGALQDAEKRIRELEKEVERHKSTVATLTLEMEKLKSQLAARSKIEGMDDALKTIEEQKEEIDLLKEQLLNARATPNRLRSLTGSRPSSIARPPTRSHLRNKPGSLTETNPPEPRSSVDDDDVPLPGPTRASGISSSVRRQRAATSAPAIAGNPFGGGLASIIAQQAMERSPGSRRVRVSPMAPKPDATPEEKEAPKEVKAEPENTCPVSPPVRQAEVTVVKPVVKEPEPSPEVIPSRSMLRKVSAPVKEAPESNGQKDVAPKKEEPVNGISKFGLKRVARPPPQATPAPEAKETVPPFMKQLRKTNPPRPVATPAPVQESPVAAAPVNKFAQLKKVTKPESKPTAGGGGSTYSLEELKKFPAGVDRKQMELHLNPDDFQAAFGASKDEFNSWAPWKKERAKKKIGLW